jgi:hypothetical protein
MPAGLQQQHRDQPAGSLTLRGRSLELLGTTSYAGSCTGLSAGLVALLGLYGSVLPGRLPGTTTLGVGVRAGEPALPVAVLRREDSAVRGGPAGRGKGRQGSGARARHPLRVWPVQQRDLVRRLGAAAGHLTCGQRHQRVVPLHWRAALVAYLLQRHLELGARQPERLVGREGGGDGAARVGVQVARGRRELELRVVRQLEPAGRWQGRCICAWPLALSW